MADGSGVGGSSAMPSDPLLRVRKVARSWLSRTASARICADDAARTRLVYEKSARLHRRLSRREIAKSKDSPPRSRVAFNDRRRDKTLELVAEERFERRRAFEHARGRLCDRYTPMAASETASSGSRAGSALQSARWATLPTITAFDVEPEPERLRGPTVPRSPPPTGANRQDGRTSRRIASRTGPFCTRT
jgi:hypothetical protein